MNRTLGKAGAAVTGLSVLAFAVSMIVTLFAPPAEFASYFSSLWIAIGFLPFMISVACVNKDRHRQAVGLTGLAFAVVYAVIIFLVYYAQCTTVWMSDALSDEALSILSFGHLGSLFFNYDLLGYAFMSLSTFLIAFTVEIRDRWDKAFRLLLWIHGVFFISCLLMPMLPVFTPDTDSRIGTVILEIWCLYFLPVCALGLHYFRDKPAGKKQPRRKN